MMENRQHMRKFTSSSLRDSGYEYAIEVDCDRARFRGRKLSHHDSTGKRKFENLLMLTVLGESKEVVKVLFKDW